MNLLVFLLLTAGVNLFSDQSVTSGMSTTHDVPFGSSEFGLGQTWFDYNNDGNLDLYLTNQETDNKLFTNQGDGTFVAANFSALNITGQTSKGATVADFDNDGWDDLFVTTMTGNHLLKNNNGTSFTDVTVSSGLSSISRNSYNSAWADYNNDGYLDLYVINYANTNISPDAEDEIYFNNGDGTFTNISADFDSSETQKPALAITIFDYDNDGDMDIYVVNDKEQGNTLWKNVGPATMSCGTNWCFENVSVATGANRPVFGMGVSADDYDLDGDFDLYFSSIGEQVLLQNQMAQGSETFIEKSSQSGLNLNTVGWGTVFFDIDNDGWIDAYIATFGNSASDQDRLYLNNGDTTFTDVTSTGGISNTIKTQGAAPGDYDNDGKIDLVTGNWSTDYKLFKNEIVNSNNWIKLKLTGTGQINRNAIGSLVKITLSDGRILSRLVHSGSSFGGGNSRVLHFGLGQSTITHIQIIWPDKASYGINTYQANQLNEVTFTEYIFQSGFDN